VQEAWERGQEVAVHAWIYGLDNGLIQDLGLDVRGREQLPEAYEKAVTELTSRWECNA
jgi:carbonic anhydrase